ncbi:MAG TPA: dienelactone hydrolase family protein, partial [Chloroflexota bacterium]
MQWNAFNTSDRLGIATDTVNYGAGKGDQINAYIAMPLGDQKRGGVVLIHHMPGWDEFYRETANRFALHGYNVMCPN